MNSLTEVQPFESPQKTLKNRIKKLQIEMKAVKDDVSLVDFQSFVIECNPKYNNPQGFEFIRKVWYKSTSSVELTEIMEQMKNNIIKK